MKANSIRPEPGSRRRRKRLGRGDASGHGGTSTKGHKGQKARSGGLGKRGFEGGQMPLTRRLPKFGFTNLSRRNWAILNLDSLAEWPVAEPVTEAALVAKGLVRTRHDGVKLLGRGDCPGKLTVTVSRVSASARQKIEAAGGTVQLVS